MIKSYYKFFILLPFIACAFIACKDEDINLRMTHNERNRIDTIYGNRIDSLRPIWDSICEAQHSEAVKLAVDSIVRLRLEEEAKLRAR